MEEIEVKFLDVNPAEIEKKLRGIGAEKVGDFSYRRRVFDYPDWRLDTRGAWLRLRDEGDRITLSFKQRLGMASEGSDGNDTGMEETEIVVDDFVKTAQLILKLGFVENTMRKINALAGRKTASSLTSTLILRWSRIWR